MADPKDDQELTHADLEKVSGGKPAALGPPMQQQAGVTINKAKTQDAAYHLMDNYIKG